MARRSNRSLERVLSLVVVIFFPTQADAQVFDIPPVPPVLTSGSIPLLNPFVGGFESPILQLVDLDGDGDLDIALTDRDRRLRVFDRMTVGGADVWTARPEPVPSVSVASWFRFADLDGDGDQDLFISGPSSGIAYLKNIGSSSSLILDPRPIPLLDTNGAPVINESVNIPAFADPDGDGDLDFFAGNSAGSIVYYENVGTPTAPSFRFRTNAYQGITIIGFGSARPDTGNFRRLHGAMGIEFGDLDGDADLDILWGDFFSPSLYFLRNSGTTISPVYTLEDSTFPDAYPAISSGFNVPALGDIDSDGDLDMLVTVASGFQSTKNIFLFRNIAGAAMADLRMESLDPLQAFDVGSMSRPAVGEMTGDGLEDIIIASGSGIVRLVRQVASGSSVSAFEVDADTLISIPGSFFLDPAICDLDGDGSNEILLGDFTGTLKLFVNAAGWAEDTTFQLRGIVLGQSISPAIGDIDRDGDQDLVLGLGNGRLMLYENTGSRTSPFFVERPGMLDNVDAMNDAVPVLHDFTGDGDPDLIVGSRNLGIQLWVHSLGGFYRYPNSLLPDLGSVNAAPAMLEHEGRGLLLYGNIKGGLQVLERTGRMIRSLHGRVVDHPFPNPASTELTVEYQLSSRQHVSIGLFDILGREVLRVKDADVGPGYMAETFGVRELPSGAYFLRVRSSESVVYPVIVVR